MTLSKKRTVQQTPTNNEEKRWEQLIEQPLRILSDMESKRGGERRNHVMSLTWPVNLVEKLDLYPYTIPVIQIVGSKGKGSTALFLEHILRHAGLRTGLYQSPHLLHRTERIRIDGVNSTTEQWSRSFQAIDEKQLEMKQLPSRFELETVLALHCFAQEKVDVVILEAGLGRRYDATSVVPPSLLILTSLELEHTDHLGHSLEQIAQQKLGGVPPQTPVVVGPMSLDSMKIVRAICRENETPIIEVGVDVAVDALQPHQEGIDFQLAYGSRRQRHTFALQLPIYGLHQPYLYAAATAAAQTFFLRKHHQALPSEALQHNQSIHLPGRLQDVPGKSPFWIDSAHTPRSITAGLEAFHAHLGDWPDLVLFGLNEDKAVEECLTPILASTKRLLLVPIPGTRSLAPDELRDWLGLQRPVPIETFDHCEEGFLTLQRYREQGLSCWLTGSFTLAAAAIRWWDLNSNPPTQASSTNLST